MKTYLKSDYNDLIDAIKKGNAKISKLSNFESLNGLTIEKVIVTFSERGPVLHLLKDGINNEYMNFWKNSAIGKLYKDVKKNEIDRYNIIVFQSSTGLKKALIREFTEFQESMEEYKLQELVSWIEKTESLHLEINEHWYSIIKIVNESENWNKKQLIRENQINSLEDLEENFIEIGEVEESDEDPLF